MEAAEVEFLRDRGMHVSWSIDGTRFGFPRVSATCDYLKPARFEEILEITVAVQQVGKKSVSWTHDFRRYGVLLAQGKITSVCVRVGPDHTLESIEIPAEIRAKLEA